MFPPLYAERLIILTQDFFYLGRFDATMYVFVHDYNRPKSASAKTADGFEREHAVCSCLSVLDAELFFQGLRQFLAAAHVAGGAQTNAD